MFSSLSPRALARSSAEHPKRVIWIWVATLIVAFAVIAQLLAGVLSPAQSFVTTPEGQRAANQIQQITGSPDAVVEQVVVTASKGTFANASLRTQVDSLTGKLKGLGPTVVASAISPTADPQLVSKDGTAAVIQVVMAGSINEARDNIAKVLDTAKSADGVAGLDVKVTGLTSIEKASNKVAENDLKVGETIGIGIGLIILALVFGALVSALLPLILAIAAIIVALALTALVGQIGVLSFFVQNMITMMGLAVGIDYSLFIVSRYREERALGVAKLDAIERAGATSSRAVFFSGITVVVALLSLLIVPMSVFVSLGLGAILAVLAAVAAALTLLPALLSVLGAQDREGTARSQAQGGRRAHGFLGRRGTPALLVRAGQRNTARDARRARTPSRAERGFSLGRRWRRSEP